VISGDAESLVRLHDVIAAGLDPNRAQKNSIVADLNFRKTEIDRQISMGARPWRPR